jgi:hypothetical protein
MMPSESRFVVVKLKTPPSLDSSTAFRSVQSTRGAVQSILEDRPVARLFTRETTGNDFAFRSARSAGSPQPVDRAFDRAQYLRVEGRSFEDARALVATLNRQDDVDLAYVDPIPKLPIFDEASLHDRLGQGPPPMGATPDFSAFQSYLGDAPAGLGVRGAWQRLSDRKPGAGVRGADVEYGWILDHEDFGQGQVVAINQSSNEDAERQHGTACVGLAVGVADSHGITGIVPGVDKILCSSVTCRPAAEAIDAAANELSSGDVLLVELHAGVPEIADARFLPMEFWEATFRAVEDATARGLVVVAAAGNGGVDLDDTSLKGKFDWAAHDSGAILVGAGVPPGIADQVDRARVGFSNFGRRVDVQGYGGAVCTTGIGDLQGSTTAGVQRWYTNQFDGTSSATAMVWAGCILLQSIALAHNRQPLRSREMRKLLIDTGSSQQGPNAEAEHIGPRPDFAAAAARLLA